MPARKLLRIVTVTAFILLAPRLSLADPCKGTVTEVGAGSDAVTVKLGGYWKVLGDPGDAATALKLKVALAALLSGRPVSVFGFENAPIDCASHDYTNPVKRIEIE